MRNQDKPNVIVTRLRAFSRASATCNRPFPSSLVPLFQSESKCATLSYENDFDLHEKLIRI